MTKSVDLSGGGGTSFQFNVHGASVRGIVADMEEAQQTDLKTGALKSFDSGQPMMMHIVTLKTGWRNSEGLAEAVEVDDGTRTIYLKGGRKAETMSSMAAVLGAVKAATGTGNITVGGDLTLTYVGDHPAERGQTAAKKYTSAYVAPSTNLDAAAPAPPAPAPVTPPAPAPTPPTPVQAAPPVPAPAGLSPEQAAAAAAYLASQAAPAAAWDADPRVPGLRAQGLPDDAIRSILGI